MAFDPTTAKPLRVSSSGFDPSTAQPVQQAVDPIGAAVASVGGIAEGTVDALSAAGTLARTILTKNQKEFTHPLDKAAVTAMDFVRDKWQTVQGLRNSPTQYEQQAQAANPVAHALGQGTGNVITTLGLAGLASKPLQVATDTAVSAAPSMFQGPIIGPAINQGLQGTVAGAIVSPEDPGWGALWGGLGGAVLGAFMGVLSNKLQRMADVVDFEFNNLKDAGINPRSIEGMSRIKNQLKANGVDFSKNEVQKVIDRNIRQVVDDINPLMAGEAPPAVRIGRLATTNFNKVKAEIKELTAPLRSAPGAIETTAFNSVKDSLKPLKKLLPGELGKNPTINDVWNYRTELDSTIASIRRVGTATEKASLGALLKAREALGADMTTAAKALGLDKNLATANAKYISEYLPFASYKGKANLGEFSLNQAMQALNRVFKARNPDFTKLNNIAKTLGKDGHDLIAQGMMESAIRRSVNDKGLINPSSLFSKIRDFDSSGVADTMWGQKSRDALMGVKRILDGAGESLQLGEVQDATKQALISLKIPNLFASRPGVELLRIIGSSKTPQKQVRKLVTDTIDGITARTK